MLIPCHQPLEPATKALYAGVLLAVAVALTLINIWHVAPAPLACRIEFHC